MPTTDVSEPSGGLYEDKWMQMALHEAEEALKEGEVPVGCVVVDIATSTLLATGRNATNRCGHALAHAEFMAFQQISQSLSEGRGGCGSVSCALYVTVEPCLMCAAMLRLHTTMCSHRAAEPPSLVLRHVFFGCANPRFGGNGSVLALHSDRFPAFSSSSQAVVAYSSDGGHRAEEAVKLLQRFYERENMNCPGHKRRRKNSTTQI